MSPTCEPKLSETLRKGDWSDSPVPFPIACQISGTRLACISWAPDAKLRNQLLPPFDTAFSMLLTDLVARGLLEPSCSLPEGAPIRDVFS